MPRMSAKDFARLTGQKLPNKFHAKQTIYDGHSYASGAEAARAAELDIKLRAREIKAWKRQPRFELGVPENIYFADFEVTGNDDGVWIEDVKGKMTPKFRRDVKLWKAYGPHPLHIIMGRKTTVIPPGSKR